MNCKFHPTAEAVTKCAVCDAEMCSMCAKGAFYENDGKPVCLECSLQGAEEDLTLKKDTLKNFIKNGIIASVIWIVGACLLPLGGFGILIMLVAAIFFFRSALLFSKEKGFFEKLKDIFWGIVFATLLCPFYVIYILICDKMDVSRATKKIEAIKSALNN